MFNKKNNKGFSIIEVLIVLAIAGLIMLIVFLAVPALQRNARNQSRASDAQKFAAAVNQCLANNNGKQTNCVTTSTTSGTNAVIWDPAVDAGQLTTAPTYPAGATAPTHPATAGGGGGAAVPNTTGITWKFGYRCDGASPTVASVREFVVLYNSEGGSSTAQPACINS